MIQVLDHASDFGGGQTILMQIIGHLDGADVPFEVYLPRGGRRYDELVARHRSQTRALPANRRNRLLDMLRLNLGLAFTRAAWRQNAKVYVNGTRLLPFVILRAMLFRYAQVAVHLHVAPGRFVRLLVKLLQRIQPHVSLICCSDYIRDIAAHSFVETDLHLLENALGPDYVAYAERCTSKCRSDGQLEVGIVGGVHPNKGQDLVLSMPEDLVGRMRIHVIGPMIGEGGWSADLVTRAPSNVVFAGPQSDVARYYEEAQIDVSIVPSRWAEPFGLVAIEGMALDTVTLVRSVGNLPFISEKTGALTFTTDATCFASLRTLLDAESAALIRLKNEQRHRTLAQYGHYRIGEVLGKIGMIHSPPSWSAQESEI